MNSDLQVFLETARGLSVRRGGEIGSTLALPSGHVALDAQLPGGGWPLGGLSEVLSPQPGLHTWTLLLPALVQAARPGGGPVVLVQAPMQPFTPHLAAAGLPAERLLCIQAPTSAGRLWATEQALRCGEVSAVLAWLPQSRAPELRRLQLAAARHARLAFVFRGLDVRDESSPAPLRLRVDRQGAALAVHLLKRRGPPLESPILLPAHGALLQAFLAARRGPAGASVAFPESSRSHGLDRAVPVP